MQSISSRFLLKNIESCIGLGIDEDEILGLVPGGKIALHNPIQRFNGAVLLAIFERAESLSGDPAIGFRCGLNHGHVTYNDLAFTVLHCKNLQESFDIAAKYEPLAQQFGENELCIRGDVADITWRTYEDAPDKYRHISDLSFATLAHMGLWMKAVHNLPITYMQVRHNDDSYKDFYVSMFNCPVEYGAKADTLTFDKRFLEVPLPQANSEMLSLLTQRLDRDLAALSGPLHEDQQVAAYIETILGKQPATLGRVSALMKVSERSLRRRLKDCGTSFRQLLEDVRRERYELLVRQPELSQVQIAGMLGYSEQSSFSRAYKSWHGASPMKGSARVEA